VGEVPRACSESSHDSTSAVLFGRPCGEVTLGPARRTCHGKSAASTPPTRRVRAFSILPAHRRASHRAAHRYVISGDGKTATKGKINEAKPLWYQQGCLFDEVIDEGQKSWTFTIKQAKYDDAHMFLGVADATGDAMAWGFSPTTGALYFQCVRAGFHCCCAAVAAAVPSPLRCRCCAQLTLRATDAARPLHARNAQR
jgi:hypothetical protein